jgi:PAS domain S-box-containing protein
MTDEKTGTESTPVSAPELQAVYHSVDDAIFIHDSAGGIIDVNQAAAEMYGYSRSELRDGGFSRISSGEPPYTDANANERVKRAAEGDAQTFEWQGQDRDGNVFWEEVSLSRTTVDGETRVLAIVRDIDDRKHVERRFQTLIDNLPGIVYRCRNESGWPMLFVGGQSEALTGYSADTIESDTVSWGEDIVHPDDRERLRQAIESAIAASEPFEVTYRILTADGEERWVWERGQQVNVSQQSSTILEGFISDITDQHKYEEELESQRDNLEVLNQVLRHDIRNDLQLVTVYADRLEDSVDEHQEYVETIRESARHAVELTTTARDMADVWLSENEELTPIPLASALENVLDEARSVHTNSIITVDGDIPDATVLVDDMITSVFQNLVQNAIQHNDKEIPKVEVSVKEGEQTVQVRVADNGTGVPDSRKEAIFGKSEKGLDSAGTGLGLYLVKTLIERYDGSVWVEDNEPEGAVFVVELQKASPER